MKPNYFPKELGCGLVVPVMPFVRHWLIMVYISYNQIDCDATPSYCDELLACAFTECSRYLRLYKPFCA